MFIKTTKKKLLCGGEQEKGEACFLKCMNILSNGPSKKRRGVSEKERARKFIFTGWSVCCK